MVALKLADLAHATGLSGLGHHLETVALEAGAEAAARKWPADVPEA